MSEQGTAEEWEEINRNAPNIKTLLENKFGKPLPKHMHLECGWGGDNLNEDGTCPGCGELHPWVEDDLAEQREAQP